MYLLLPILDSNRSVCINQSVIDAVATTVRLMRSIYTDGKHNLIDKLNHEKTAKILFIWPTSHARLMILQIQSFLQFTPGRYIPFFVYLTYMPIVNLMVQKQNSRHLQNILRKSMLNILHIHMFILEYVSNKHETSTLHLKVQYISLPSFTTIASVKTHP